MEEEKDITINELAVIINKGFRGQMDYMEKKFDAIDKRFEDVDKKFEDLKKDVNFLKENAIEQASIPHRVEYIENVLNITPAKK
ncbi:MAG TPA: hypothetical protein PLF16_03025 [Candidatus Staskawiczbacteria bacterium]|nr:hypothetical protein [Candidatus Staskawiczbacteria bacterium]